MSDYPHLTLNQLTAIADRETVMLTGLYSRHPDQVVLTQGDQRLPLLDLPFSWLPPQGCTVRIWGELLQGKPRRLLVHDACHASGPIPEPRRTPTLRTGMTVTLTVQVNNVGDEQVARTADRCIFNLIGDELDERKYLLSGELITLNPPTLVVLQAIPILQSTPAEVTR